MTLRSWTSGIAIVAKVALVLVLASVAPALASEDLSPAKQIIDWSQNRLAEFDAVIASFEHDSAKRQGEVRQKADAVLNDLRKTREAYRLKVSEARSHLTTWTDSQVADARKSLDDVSTTFHAKMGEYLDEAKADAAARRTVLDAEFAARQKAWQKSVDELRTEASKLDAKKRADMNGRIDALKAQMDDTKARIARLGDTSREAWTAVTRDYAQAEQRFFDTVTSIRRSLKDAAKS